MVKPSTRCINTWKTILKLTIKLSLMSILNFSVYSTKRTSLWKTNLLFFSYTCIFYPSSSICLFLNATKFFVFWEKGQSCCLGPMFNMIPLLGFEMENIVKIGWITQRSAPHKHVLLVIYLTRNSFAILQNWNLVAFVSEVLPSPHKNLSLMCVFPVFESHIDTK